MLRDSTEGSHTVNKQVGVADGVGGWARHGIDAGEYARQLMSNAWDALEEDAKQVGLGAVWFGLN